MVTSSCSKAATRWAKACSATLTAILLLALTPAISSATEPNGTYQATVAADSPATQYRLNDAAEASEIADSAGSCPASNNGGTLGEPGPFPGSKALKLGGFSSATMSCNPLKEHAAFTIEGWVNWTGSTTGQAIVSIGSSSSNYMYLTPENTSNKRLQLEIHTAGGTATVTGSKKLAAGWAYVTVTETSAGTLTLYVNGEVEGTPAEHATVSPASLGASANDDYIGRTEWPTATRFNGELSNIAFYTTALSAERVKAHYNAGEFPTNSAPPSISGTLREGNTLTASPGTWAGASTIKYAYQWWRCNATGTSCPEEIKKATKSTYLTTATDADHVLEVAVEASNKSGHGNAAGVTSTPIEGKPQNNALPVIEGSAQAGTVLSVSEGSWAAFPAAEIFYQWEKCNSTGGECENLSGAVLAKYTPKNTQVGHTLRAAVTAKNSVGSTVATSAPSHAVTASACTDEWVGASGGSWTEAANWSKGTVPTSSDDACIEPGVTVNLTGGANKVGEVEGEGTLQISGGALETTSTSKHSTLKGLSLSGGSLSIAGELDVTGSFSATGEETIGGSGRLVLRSGSSGTIAPGGGCSSHTILDSVTLVNEGALGFGTSADVAAGAMVMNDGAQFQNAGTFTDDSYDSGCGYGVGGSNYTIYSTTGAAPSITNTGAWKGEAGSSTLVVAVPFTNNGTVEGHTGTLALAAGGSGNGTYTAASSAALALQGGAFSLSAATWSGSGTITVDGASVTGTSLKGTGANVSVSGGTLTIPTGTPATLHSLSLSGGSLSIAGELDVTGSFSATGEETIGGSGRLVLRSGSSGTIAPGGGCSSHTILDSVTLVNEGALGFGTSADVAAGAMVMNDGAQFQNAGTFTDDSYDSGCGYGVGGSNYTIYSTTGAAPSITNTGAWKGEAGSSTLVVAVPFTNNGTVEGHTGTLALAAGGSGSGTYTAPSGGAVSFAGGSFSLSSATWSGAGAIIVNGATVTATSLKAPTAAVFAFSGALTIPTGTTATVQSLYIPGGTVSIAGALNVTSTIRTNGSATISGPGQLVLEPGSSGTLDYESCNLLTLDEITLRNEGTLTVGASGGASNGAIVMRDGARLLNVGTLNLDSWDPGCGFGYGGNSVVAAGGSTPSITNTGNVTTNASGQTILVNVPYNNQGSTRANAATLNLHDGGLPGVIASGSWQTENGGAIILSGGEFLIAETVDLSDVRIEGATVTRRPTSGPPHGNLEPLPYAAGTVTVAGSGESIGSGFTSATIEVRASTGAWGTLCGPLTPFLAGAFSCEWETRGYADGSYQLRAKLSDGSEPPNTGTTPTITTILDNTAPAGTLASYAYLGPNSTIDGSATDAGSGVASWQPQISPAGKNEWADACPAQSTPTAGSNYECKINVAPTSGNYEIRALITDHAGNTATTTPHTTSFDSTPPEGTLASLSEPAYKTATLTVHGNAEDSGSGVKSWILQTAPSGTSSWSDACEGSSTGGSGYSCTIDTTHYADGTYQTRAEITDNVGNTHDTATQTITIDNGPPNGKLTYLPRSSSATITVEGEASDQISGIATWTLQIAPAHQSEWQQVCPTQTSLGSSGKYSCTIDTTRYSDGAYQLRALITNHAGGSDATTAIPARINNGGGEVSSCTDTWTGAGPDSSWNTATDWSSGTVPTSSDVVCIPAGAHVHSWQAANAAAWVESEGELAVEGASLELGDTAVASTISEATIQNGTLSVAGNLTITHNLGWHDGGLSGPGQTTIQSGATGTIGNELSEQHLINDGTLTYSGDPAFLSHDAAITNNATLAINDTGEHCGYGCTPGLHTSTGGLLQNTSTGTITKNLGGTTYIGVPFNNEGTVETTGGNLELESGGTTSEPESASWHAPAGRIEFRGGTFTLGATASMSGRIALTGGTLETGKLTAPHATIEVEGGTLQLDSATSTIETLKVGRGPYGTSSDSALAGNGNLAITGELEWSEGAISGHRQLEIATGAKGSITTFGNVELDETELLNNGTLDWGGGALTTSNAAKIINNATFEANDDGPHCGYGCTGGGILPGPGAAASLQNTSTGKVVKNAGEYSWIAIPFDNDGTLNVETGQLKIEGGETPGHTASGSWAAASGALLEFNGGTFNLAPNTHISGRLAVTGHSTVTTSALEGAAATMEIEEGTLELNGGKSTFEAVNLGPGPNGEGNNALLDGGGDIEIDKSLHWEEGVFAGSGQVALEPGSENRIDPFGYAILIGKTLINYGRANWQSGTLTSAAGAELLNEGTFETNDTYGAECYPGYCRDMRTPAQIEEIYGKHPFAGSGYPDTELITGEGKFVNEGVTNNDGTSCPEYWGETRVRWPTSGRGEFSSSCTKYEDRTTPASPEVEGIAEEGQQLQADPGVWESIPYPTFTYQWQRCGGESSESNPSEESELHQEFGRECADISGATSDEYSLTAADVGHRVRVLVTGHRRLSNLTVASETTLNVLAEGNAAELEEEAGAEEGEIGFAPENEESEPAAAFSLVQPIGEYREGIYVEHLCPGAPGARCGKYNTSAAVEHAEQWAIGPHGEKEYWDPRFTYFAENDCADFASQALWAGGLRYMRAHGLNQPYEGPASRKEYDETQFLEGPGEWWSYYVVPGGGIHSELSHTWSVAKELYSHLLEFGLARVVDRDAHQAIRPGDIIFYDEKGPSLDYDHITHAAVVIKSRNNKVWVAQHTNAYRANFGNVLKRLETTFHSPPGGKWAYVILEPTHAAANV